MLVPCSTQPSQMHARKEAGEHICEWSTRAPLHLDLQINAEKSPYLTEKLKIWMLPTLALIKSEKVEDYVVGFQVSRVRGRARGP